jgi:Tol biopolymer transport system component
MARGSLSLPSELERPASNRKSANGTGGEEKLLETDGASSLADWSRDGRYLTYNTQGVTWILPLEGDRKPFRLLKATASESFSRFSPDGKWVTNPTRSGKFQVYVQPFPPGAGRLGQMADIGGWGRGWAMAR